MKCNMVDRPYYHDDHLDTLEVEIKSKEFFKKEVFKNNFLGFRMRSKVNMKAF